jgi:inositol-phosphate phosphatase/L-galactose 1-phosphate phosphatase/histidinol-phosphatase
VSARAGLDPATVDLVRFAEELADVSRGMLARAAVESTRVDVKPDRSFVTEADRAIEVVLRERITAAYPDHGILGEEYGPHRVDAETVWVLDPIDGTAPFIAGIPVYATLIGVSRFGRPWIGVLDFPATDDRWVGVSGVYATRNGVDVRARRCRDLDTALMTCSNPDFLDAEEYPAFAKIRDYVQYTLYGASGYAYALLASGRTDLAVDSGLKPYDIFAPAAVISGAGGVVTGWAGEDLDLRSTRQRVVAAGDPDLHETVVALLG